MMLGLKKVRWPPGRCVAADALDLQPVQGAGTARGNESYRAARAIMPPALPPVPDEQAPAAAAL